MSVLASTAAQTWSVIYCSSFPQFYRAPELMDGASPQSTSSNVYTFGELCGLQVRLARLSLQQMPETFVLKWSSQPDYGLLCVIWFM